MGNLLLVADSTLDAAITKAFTDSLSNISTTFQGMATAAIPAALAIVAVMIVVPLGIRAVVEFETRHKRVSHVNGLGVLMSLPFRGQLFVAVTDYYAVRGKHDVVGKKFIVGRKSVFDIYDTHAMFD